MDVFDSYNVYFSNLSICELKLIYKSLDFYCIAKVMILDYHNPIEQLIVLKFSPTKTNQFTGPFVNQVFKHSLELLIEFVCLNYCKCLEKKTKRTAFTAPTNLLRLIHMYYQIGM